MSGIFEAIGISQATQTKSVASLVVIITLFSLRWLVVRAIHRRLEDSELTYRSRKVTTYVTVLLGALVLAWVWIDALSSFPTYLGIVSAGIAIALTDVIKSMAGWAYIMLRRPFRVGDRVEISATKGDVVDIRLFRFSILEVGNWVDAEQSTGRLIHVPNGALFTERLANYSEGFEYIWHEVPVLVTFESDWKEAREILAASLDEVAPRVEAEAGRRIRLAARSYNIRFENLAPRVYLTVRDSGVLLTARLLVDVRERRGVDEAIWEHVLDGFAKTQHVELAYPTIRAFRHDVEG